MSLRLPPVSLSLPTEGEYRSFDELYAAAQEHAKAAGYAFVKGHFEVMNGGRERRLLVCDRYGKHRTKVTEATRQRRGTSNKTDCKFSIIALQKHEGWELRHRPGAIFRVHNHPASENPENLPMHRARDPKPQKIAPPRFAPPSTASKLRDMLNKEENAIIVCPGVYDGFSARLAINAGFKTLYMTGAGTTMSKLGMADLGVATMNDMRDHAAMLASINPTIPLIADADTGYGGPLMVGRTTAAYINAGVAAFHIEDQVVNKRCGHLNNKELVDEGTFVARVRAAATMRQQLSRDIVIIVRTDALAGWGYDVALRRLKLAIDVGADVAFLEGVRSKDEAWRICHDLKPTPVLYNCVPGGVSPIMSVQEAADCGFKMVITPTLALGAVHEAVSKVFEDLRKNGNTAGNEVPIRTLFEACGLNESVEFDTKAGGQQYANGV